MRRGTIFIILFIVVAAAIIGGSALLRNQPALELRVAVDPLAEAWVRDMAARFNDSATSVGVGRRVRIVVEVISDVNVLDPSRAWRPGQQPDGWIASWSELARYYTPGFGITRSTIVPSLARTALVWMSAASKTSDVPELSWTWVQSTASGRDAAEVAFSLPTTSQGIAVLLSAMADFSQTGNLTNELLASSSTRALLAPVIQSVSNFNTLGADVALYVAGPRGSTVGVAIAPESQWLAHLSNLRQTRGELRFAYPSNLLVFDFPLIGLIQTEGEPERAEGIRAFGAFLSDAPQQQAAFQFGLRPAIGEPDPTNAVFMEAQQFGIAPSLGPSTITLPDTFNGIQSLLTWFGQQ